MSRNPLESVKQQIENSGTESEESIEGNLRAISSFILYGKPWKKL